LALHLAIPRLKKNGIVGKDVHKPDKPEIPEMGGLFLVVGFAFGLAMVIAFNTFMDRFLSIDLSQIMAVLSVVLTIAVVGIIDDLLDMPQSIKAFLPLIASFPLIAIRSGDTTMSVPFAGDVNFGLVYSLVLVPIGVTGAANATNMLAGFNGVEAGMGLVAMSSLAGVAYLTEETAAFLILISAIGAMIAFLYFNWYPAKVFIGDVGTLSIGAIIASSVIIGNFEKAGVIVIIPYLLDFAIKAKNHFPSRGWWGIYKDGKICCPESGPVGMGQLILKITGGVSERNLTLILMGLEAICGIIAVLIYW
jgi:UDP-N-acetylglucosamine--dolichyl-phosphate N-acetylglucosaminephosphotransferase